MADKTVTRVFYTEVLGFNAFGGDNEDKFSQYLMIWKDSVEIHFFLKESLDPAANDGKCYIRTGNVEEWYQTALEKGLEIPEMDHLKDRPWMQREFSILDPNGNHITFGQSLV